MNYTNYNDIKIDERIENVPVYNVKDIQAINYRLGNMTCLRDDGVSTLWVRPSNRQGPQNCYVLATPELQDYVNKYATFAILKGTMTKKPKIYKKDVYVQLAKYNNVFAGVAI